MVIGGAAVVLCAAFLGGVVGFAYALVALPLLLLVGLPLEQVVVVNLVIALLTRIFVLAVRWRDVSWPRAARMVLGALPGTATGLWVVDDVPERDLQLASGTLVLLVVVGLIARDRHSAAAESMSGRRARPLEWIAGVLGGFLGSTTSLNGVPPALLLTGRRANARQIVADLAVFFVVGNLVTLTLLGVGGRLPLGEVAPLLLWWVPVGVGGTLLGVRLGPSLPVSTFRRLTMCVITASALACLWQGLSG